MSARTVEHQPAHSVYVTLALGELSANCVCYLNKNRNVRTFQTPALSLIHSQTRPSTARQWSSSLQPAPACRIPGTLWRPTLPNSSEMFRLILQIGSRLGSWLPQPATVYFPINDHRPISDYDAVVNDPHPQAFVDGIRAVAANLSGYSTPGADVCVISKSKPTIIGLSSPANGCS